MALPRRIPVDFFVAFPQGLFLVGAGESCTDFNAPQRPDGTRPQQIDKESNLPLWQFQVVDAHCEASKRERTLSIKVAAAQQPVPPANDTGFPFTPVELIGLTAMPYVEDTGTGRPRVAWSYRAQGLCAPGKAPKSTHDAKAA